MLARHEGVSVFQQNSRTTIRCVHSSILVSFFGHSCHFNLVCFRLNPCFTGKMTFFDQKHGKRWPSGHFFCFKIWNVHKECYLYDIPKFRRNWREKIFWPLYQCTPYLKHYPACWFVYFYRYCCTKVLQMAPTAMMEVTEEVPILFQVWKVFL